MKNNFTLYENFPYFMGSNILYEYDCNDTEMTNYPYIVYMCIMTIEFILFLLAIFFYPMYHIISYYYMCLHIYVM
jgi:hypothetical protein